MWLTLSCASRGKPPSQASAIPSGYQIEGAFSLEYQGKRERGFLYLLVQSPNRLFIEFTKQHVSLSQISFNSLEFQQMNVKDGVVICSRGDNIPYFKDDLGVELTVSELIEALDKSKELVKKNYLLTLRNRKEFDVGRRPSLVVIKKQGRVLFSLRIKKWRQRFDLTPATFELGRCASYR